MTRLNRKEMQERTHQRLLEAAEREIARRGIDAASLRMIAEAAGHSLGAFYSNFSSKEDLLRELLATHMRKEMDLLRSTLADDSSASPAETLAKLAALLSAMREDEVLSGLVVEFHLYANRNPTFRREFYESKNQRLSLLAEGISALFERFDVELSVDPRSLAQGFSALWVGFAIQGKEGGGDRAEEVTVLFFDALLSRASPTLPPVEAKAGRKRGRG